MAAEHKKKFACKICSRKFSIAWRLELHIKVDHENTGAEKHKCPQCPNEYKSRNCLFNHIKSKHKSVKCDLCHEHFSQVGERDQHIDEVHSGDKRLQCDSWCQQYKHFLYH